MKDYNDSDQFLVDINHGGHYHVRVCRAVGGHNAHRYAEMTYAEIKKLRVKSGLEGAFAPDYCVFDWESELAAWQAARQEKARK